MKTFYDVVLLVSFIGAIALSTAAAYSVHWGLACLVGAVWCIVVGGATRATQKETENDQP